MNTRTGDFPEEVVKLFPKVEVFQVEKKDFDHGGTRNMGAEKSDADYLLFMTQDALPADEYLVEQLFAEFQNPQVRAAYARQLPREDCRELERYTRSFNYPEESCVKTREDLPRLGIKTFFCSNVCAMYDRRTYMEQGGFVRHTIFNEDMIYAGGLIKGGYAVAYAAKAQVYHSHNYSGLQQLRRNFDLAVSQADHPEVFAGVASESEGIRLVKKTAAHCVRIGKPWLIFSLVFSSGCKYIGYKLGRNYQRLPKAVVRACTMSPAYWAEKEEER
jgi:rhamnosyltransferase